MTTAGRIISVIIGLVLFFSGFALILGGGAIYFVNNTFTDDTGYFSTPEMHFSDTNAVALVLQNADIEMKDMPPVDIGNIIKLKLELKSENEYFIGVASSSDVNSYLSGVPYAIVRNISFNEGYDITSNLINPNSNLNLSSPFILAHVFVSPALTNIPNLEPIGGD